MLIDEEEIDETTDGEALVKISKLEKKLALLVKNNDLGKSVLVIIETLSEALETIAENKKEDSYDKELGNVLSESLSKLNETIASIAKDQKIDLTPFIKSNEKNYQSLASVIIELKQQNKDLIDLFSKEDGTEKNEKDDGLSKSIEALVESIKSTNETISQSIAKDKDIDYSKALENIAKRPTKWKHTIHYRDGLMESIESKAI